MDEEFCQKLLDAQNTEDFLKMIDAQERVKYPDEAPAAPRRKPVEDLLTFQS